MLLRVIMLHINCHVCFIVLRHLLGTPVPCIKNLEYSTADYMFAVILLMA